MRRSGMILLSSALLSIIGCSSHTSSIKVDLLGHNPLHQIDIQGHEMTSETNVCGPDHVAIPGEYGILGQECVKMSTINSQSIGVPIRNVITLTWGDGPHDSDGKVEVTGVKGTTVYDDGKSTHE